MSEKQIRLFDMFPPVTRDEWRRKIDHDLKGKPFDRLVWNTEMGIPMPPFLRSEDLDGHHYEIDSPPGQYPYRRGNFFNQASPSWQLIQEVSVDDPEMAKAIIQDAILADVFAFSLTAWAEEVAPEAFIETLDGIKLDEHALHFWVKTDPIDVLRGLNTWLKTQESPPSALTGTFFSKEEFAPVEVFALTAKCPSFRVLGIDLSWVEEDGGTMVHQLAFALSQTVDYLMQSHVNLPTVLRSLAYYFPTGSSFMPEAAKLRAFRMLFARVLEIMEIKDPELQSPFMIAGTSQWNASVYDPHTNLLRGTTEAISAVVGGAHGIVVSAYDRVSKAEDRTSARLARNIQHILKHEAYFDQVADPGGGSYYLEYLTDQLAEAAWTFFQEMETAGGYTVCKETGLLKEWLDISASRREEAIERRKKVLVGVNNYVNPGEVLSPDNDSAHRHQRRAGEGFETLRKTVESLEVRPMAFLLVYGDNSKRNARAGFCRNFFSPGGIEVVTNSEPGDIPGAIRELTEVQPHFVVLCAADEDYNDDLIDEVRKASSSSKVILAGKPTRDLNPDHYIYQGMNVLELLRSLLTPILKNNHHAS